jgi:hypothetical protein
MIRTNQAALWLMALLVTALAASCSDPDPPRPSTSSSGSGGEGGFGTSSSSSSSGGGSGGAGGTGGDAGAGGGGPMNYGPPATEIVSGGQRMKSAGYTMIYTIGQPSPHQTKSTSENYRMQGGLVGATESLP